MAGIRELSLQADLDQLKAVRAFISDAGSAFGVAEDVVGDLCLVVDEAVTNIILHGYQGRSGPLRLEVEARGRDLLVRIRDEAPAFDAGEVEAPHLDEPLSERQYGGMGVYLIRRLTDKAEFRNPPEGGNELQLLRRDVVPTE